jgi:dTDP-4-amino-4,6-dideoxy-D-galactose acyltransferase
MSYSTPDPLASSLAVRTGAKTRDSMTQSALMVDRHDRRYGRLEVDLPGPCTLLPWDTEFFGFSIARVNGDTLVDDQVADIQEWCRAEGVRCLYFLARSGDPATIRAVASHGFSLVDLRLTLERDASHSSSLSAVGLTSPGIAPSLTGAGGAPTSSPIRPVCPADMAALQAIAQSAHRDTRFFSDPHFPRPLATAFYSTWIKLECQGRAQRVFVATGDEDEALGYISCHLDASGAVGQIGLMAVNRTAQGRGLGKVLVQAALAWFADQGVNQVSVVTQGGNIPAQRLYQSCGFRSASLRLWFHKWFPDEE